MSAVLEKQNIQSVLDEIGTVSFSPESGILSEQDKINKTLDEISEVRDALDKTVAQLNFIVEKSEELTWFTIAEKDVLEMLRGLVEDMFRLRRNLIRPYADVARKFTPHGILVPRIRAFKMALDDLKEAAEDLKTTFLDERSPNEVYSDLNKQLSQLDGDSMHPDVQG